MYVLKVFVQVGLIIALLCPINVNCEPRRKSVGRGGERSHYMKHGANEHNHVTEAPCAVCPRQGECVPSVQCPAHLRPGAHNPRCHLGKHLGVCCFTGSLHAAESDHTMSAPISADDIRAAHNQSHWKMSEWEAKVMKMFRDNPETIVNVTAPSFRHNWVVKTNEEKTSELGRGGLLNLFTAQELKERQVITEDELALGLTAHTDGAFCPPQPSCSPSRYGSIDGACNNPLHPLWGAAHTGFERLLPPDYSDGTWGMRVSSSGFPLPSPRTVSTVLNLDGNFPSRIHNLLFMQFGQFAVHDISKTIVYTAQNGSTISCCARKGEEVIPPEQQHFACAPILLDPDDQFYGRFRQACMNFVRAQLAPNSDCSVGYAKQMNGVSHYIDLSQLYGVSEDQYGLLKGDGGLMNIFEDYGRELCPFTKSKECLIQGDGTCYKSGDDRGNQIISLTVCHTLWTREHNRVARALARLNPAWGPDIVYLEARRILQAEFQHIIYNEWLPALLGPQIMEIFGLSPSAGYSSSYNPHVNPALTAEFAVAAMRFGHSTVDGNLETINPHSGIHESISITDVMFEPSRLRLQPFLDRILIGLSLQPMQKVDPFITEGLSRYLFHGVNPFGLDLASINIQRGRDFAIRSYNEYRRLVGLQPVTDFSQFPPSAAQRLSAVYASPDDIELWIGGLLEEPVEGGVVGYTFANIIGDQFARLKRGDRFFYENGPDVNPGAFTPSQLAEIKKVTLSRITCDNADGIELVSRSPNSFIRSDLPGNEPVPCNSPLIPVMDLSRFKEI